MKSNIQSRKKLWFKRIWREYKEELRRYVVSRIPYGSDAEDILQEFYLELYGGPIPSGGENERLFLYRIARKAILNYYCGHFDIEEELEKLDVGKTTSSQNRMPVATSILIPLYQPANYLP